MNSKKDFYVKTSNLPANDRKVFAEWLEAYLNEQELNAALEEFADELDTDDTTIDAGELSEIADDFERKTVLPAQLRLLRSNCSSESENMSFVLVLSQWGEGNCLAAPFSRFDTPATEGEMYTGIDENGYRVLQCWNAFIVPEDVLQENSYFIRDVSEDLRLKGCQLYFHLLEGEETALPSDIVTGPAIMSAIDPRRQYLVEETALYAPLRAMESGCGQNGSLEKKQEWIMENVTSVFAAAAVCKAPSFAQLLQDCLPKFGKENGSLEKKQEWIMKNVTPVFAEREAGLAAGEEEKALSAECQVEGVSDFVTVTYEAQACILRIVCYTPDDEYSSVFDKWQILDKNGNVLGVISGERAVIENISEFDGMICLCDRDGVLHALKTGEK